MTLLARQYLIQQLGLKLSDDVELKLVNPEQLAKEGFSGDSACAVRYQKGQGSGTGRYLFAVRSGSSPVDIFQSLAWSWGIQWANLNGDQSKDDLVGAFGQWTSHAMLRDLAHTDESRSFLRSPGIPQASKDYYKQLIEIEKQGNVEAVLAFIKNQSKL